MRLLCLRSGFALLPLLWSATASASLPTYWGIGLNANTPTGSSRDVHNPFAPGNIAGYGVSFEFGQYFGPRIGYNVRLVANDINNNKHDNYVSSDILAYSTQITHQYLSGGANYKYPRYDVVFNVNVTFGRYVSLFTEYKPSLIIPDEISGQTAYLNNNDVLGFELGATKKLKWGLQANVFYHYSSLDKYSSDKKEVKTGVASVQFMGIGIKYLWGRGR